MKSPGFVRSFICFHKTNLFYFICCVGGETGKQRDFPITRLLFGEGDESEEFIPIMGGGNMIDSDDAQSHPIAHPKQVS